MSPEQQPSNVAATQMDVMWQAMQETKNPALQQLAKDLLGYIIALYEPNDPVPTKAQLSHIAKTLLSYYTKPKLTKEDIDKHFDAFFVITLQEAMSEQNPGIDYKYVSEFVNTQAQTIKDLAFDMAIGRLRTVH